MRSLATRIVPALAAAMFLSSAALAQDTTKTRPDSTAKRDTVIPPAPPAPATTISLPFDFSGTLFINWQRGGAPAERRADQNRFDLERAYLNFRGAAGDRMSYRVTLDVFQQRDTTKNGYYRGWDFRAKYAYAQYDYISGAANELKAVARLGILHTPVIDYEETFWIRGLAQAALDNLGFFSSADLGAATLISFPNKMGELYATVLNGNGYQAPETDRFKDYGARLTLTPFLATSHGILRTFAISPWGYKGYAASKYVNGQGTVLPVGDARQKDRYGVHVGIRDPRITLATQLAWRADAVETANTAVDLAPTVTTRDGRLVSAYTIVKPLAFVQAAPSWPLNVVFRYDRFTPNTDVGAHQQNVIAGLGWDLNKKSSIWVDYQDQEPKNGSTATDSRTLFVHAIVNF